MGEALILDALRLAIGGVVAAIGLMFVLGGAIGALRFPDLYTRLHAANVGNTVGAVIVIAGLAIVAPDWGVALRLALLAALIALMGPVLTQFVANAAHVAGLAPIAGKYAAPRPGAGRARAGRHDGR